MENISSAQWEHTKINNIWKKQYVIHMFVASTFWHKQFKHVCKQTQQWKNATLQHLQNQQVLE